MKALLVVLACCLCAVGTSQGADTYPGLDVNMPVPRFAELDANMALRLGNDVPNTPLNAPLNSNSYDNQGPASAGFASDSSLTDMLNELSKNLNEHIPMPNSALEIRQEIAPQQAPEPMLQAQPSNHVVQPSFAEIQQQSQVQVQQQAQAQVQEQAQAQVQQQAAQQQVVVQQDGAGRVEMAHRVNTYMASTSANTEGDSLSQAMNLINVQIMNRAKQMQAEKAWVKKVEGLIDELTTKKGKVNDNILFLHKSLLDLLRKKKQIENTILQKKLQEQLDAAQADYDQMLTTIKLQRNREQEFVKNKDKLAKTIADLDSNLKALKGESKKAQEAAAALDGHKSESELVAEQAKATLAEIAEQASRISPA